MGPSSICQIAQTTKSTTHPRQPNLRIPPAVCSSSPHGPLVLMGDAPERRRSRSSASLPHSMSLPSAEHPDQLRGRRGRPCSGADLVSCIRLFGGI